MLNKVITPVACFLCALEEIDEQLVQISRDTKRDIDESDFIFYSDKS